MLLNLCVYLVLLKFGWYTLVPSINHLPEMGGIQMYTDV